MRAHNFIDLAGERFGQLNVLDIARERGPHGEVRWCCRCACGVEMVATGYKLRNGHTKSCGCLKRRSGTDSPNADLRPILERLEKGSRTDPVTGCKLWCGAAGGFGHGHMSVLGEQRLVHRLAWEEHSGPIPAGLDCLHNCPGGDNPACWNVEHLWLGTQADNNADRDRKGVHLLLTPRGERHGSARLSEEQILAIRDDHRLNYVIGAEYGISGGHVGRIKNRDAWSHIL